jgi:hypothetical protein
MAKHHDDPKLNQFQDDSVASGLNINDLRTNCELFLLLPVKQKHAFSNQ